MAAETDTLNDFLSGLGDSANGAAEIEVEGVDGTPTEATDDIMSDFFSAIASVPTPVLDLPKVSSTGIEGMERKNGNLINEKYANQELGTSNELAERLMQPNHQWRNLNPYYVLMLDVDATEEDIKQRYRKLSTRVHPDKLRGRDDAREVFEYVKKAYHTLCDEKQRDITVLNIKHVKDEYMKERRKLLSKGVSWAVFYMLYFGSLLFTDERIAATCA
jgi:hypothetical protein